MDETARVPKPYRYRLHRLKIAYRKAYRTEPDIARPTTAEQSEAAIRFLEAELRHASNEVD